MHLCNSHFEIQVKHNKLVKPCGWFVGAGWTTCYKVPVLLVMDGNWNTSYVCVCLLVYLLSYFTLISRWCLSHCQPQLDFDGCTDGFMKENVWCSLTMVACHILNCAPVWHWSHSNLWPGFFYPWIMINFDFSLCFTFGSCDNFIFFCHTIMMCTVYVLYKSVATKSNE